MLKAFKTLKLNDESPDVKKASLMLAKHGSTIKPTSFFSIGMRSAVVAFQKRHKLKVTGEIDKKTWDCLMPKAKAKTPKK